MAAAISLLAILTISVLIIRIAAVALRHTGLPDEVARFQARSAFTGAGFTTSESEEAVNYPIRRRIISLLMVVGNLGLVSVIATVIVSFVNTENTADAILSQLLWLAGMVVLFWLVALNPYSDRVMCRGIAWALQRTGWLEQGGHTTLLQVTDHDSVGQHRVADNPSLAGRRLAALAADVPGLTPLAVHRRDGRYEPGDGRSDDSPPLEPGDVVILYGPDSAHTVLAGQGKTEE